MPKVTQHPLTVQQLVTYLQIEIAKNPAVAGWQVVLKGCASDQDDHDGCGDRHCFDVELNQSGGEVIL